MKNEEIEIEVRGRVQGINLRHAIKRFADNLSLKGLAMNKEDGSIYIIAQGKSSPINSLLSWLQKNPGFSKITQLKYKKTRAEKEYPDFRIVKDKNFFLDKTKSLLNLGKFLLTKKNKKIPGHIAIIPDGNRRWASSKGLEGTFGHYKAGTYENLEEIFNEAKKLGVKYMTIWGFSTENWKRNDGEKESIFKLILSGVEKFIKDAEKNEIRFRHIGRKNRLPKKLLLELKKLEALTKNHDKFNVQLCLDYGGRDEIIRTINKAIKLKMKKIDEQTFSKLLDTNAIPDPDLIIRTAGEKRISGFMPFQSVYSEFYFSDLYFPDFTAKELRKAIQEYSKRIRKFGGN